MAQNANTVTAPNPTYPSNFGFTGATPPNPPNYTKNTMNDPKNWSLTNPKDFPPPYYDDGTAGALQTFATNIAALASGSAATAGGCEGTYPGTDTAPFDTPNCVGAVPASSSVAHEGSGTEVTVLAPGNINYSYVGGVTMDTSRSCSCGPVLTPGTLPSPNQLHASTLSPAGATTLTSLSAGGVSGGGNATCTATGTNFTKQSVLNINGINYPTTFTSSTTISASAPKKATAGNLPVYVVTGGVTQTATVNWVFT